MNEDELGVVVGYDGSPSAREALRWAADEAESRGLPLTVCHAWEWPHQEWPGEPVPLGLVQRPAQRLVKAAAAWVARRHPHLPVNSLTDRGSASDLLVELSGTAASIVVGARGYGTLRGMAAGSVSGQVAAHARCPVIVMRGDAEERGAREARLLVVRGARAGRGPRPASRLRRPGHGAPRALPRRRGPRGPRSRCRRPYGTAARTADTMCLRRHREGESF
ncbi:universal stress protein [Nonomuraea sp. CA-218870]|uniref:universal stress protein n=1 Tax=Nonomuraea sp. CA-218870 TaxID=3239998 RepID=UPI003D8D3F52